jgi:hypothetical protein
MSGSDRLLADRMGAQGVERFGDSTGRLANI